LRSIPVSAAQSTATYYIYVYTNSQFTGYEELCTFAQALRARNNPGYGVYRS